MPLAAILTYKDAGQKTETWCVKLVVSGSYATNGDVVNLATIIPARLAKLPLSVSFDGTKGYDADYVPGADLTLGKVRFWSAAGTELVAGAYPAALTGATTLQATIVTDKFI